MSEPNIPPSEPQQEMDNTFHFLLCERCQKEVETPKLVSCFHNLCPECLEQSKSIGLCPICGTPQSQNADTPNLLFGSLQAKLRIYQKITESSDLICDSCKKEKSEFWCSNCEEFLCKPCFQCHQRFLKRESHEARSLKDLKAESSKDFLAGFRTVNTMCCSNHNDQSLSLYCSECRQSMCCTCALLDGKHMGQHCEIQKEIQCRKDKLQSMNMELKVKKVHYLATWRNLQDLVKNKEKVKNETTELIQQKIDAMLQMVKEKGEKLLTAVEERHSQDVRDITVKIQHVKGMVSRMGSSEQLTEKMHLYASNQEVMDMQPFIRECLEELTSKQPPDVDFQVQSENYTDVKNQLQALFRRITAEEEGLPTVLEEAPQQNCSVNLPAKRKYVQEEKAIQIAAKVIKTEPDDNNGMTPARMAKRTCNNPPGIRATSCPNPKKRTRSPQIPDIQAKFLTNFKKDVSSLENGSEEESSDDEPLDSNLLSSSPSEATMYSISSPMVFNPGQDILVFFDLKILSGKILQLVAVGVNSECFSVRFQLTNLKSSLGEIELDILLCYLQSFPTMPILVGYDLWSMNIPALVSALEAIKKEERFKTSIIGFLDALPLIKEKIPHAPSYTLKDLDCTYFWGQLDDTQADACAKSLRDLWTILDVNPVMEINPIIAYSSFQCYHSLQLLVEENFLSRASAQTLALQNISYSMLHSTYQKDPKRGLQRLRRHLNSKLGDTEEKIKNMNMILAYFQSLSSAALNISPETSSQGDDMTGNFKICPLC